MLTDRHDGWTGEITGRGLGRACCAWSPGRARLFVNCPPSAEGSR
ncbi:hypothetical protein [Microbispora sp. NPDC046933]